VETISGLETISGRKPSTGDIWQCDTCGNYYTFRIPSGWKLTPDVKIPEPEPLKGSMLSVESMLDETIGDISTDLADGDNPGYFRYTWDRRSAATLRLYYEPTEEAEHVATVAIFKYIGSQPT
jgi:hypothetical protein